ncbi:MAG: multidrug effflux MFS transporter [Desulfopila sp.]
MPPKTPARPEKLNKVALIITLGALSAFAPFAIDMYLASFPSIAESLDASMADVQYSVSVFFIGLAVGQLLYAPLIDRFGRRLPLLLGVILFSASAFAAVFSPNIDVFVGLRLLQAVGGCAGMIISRAIIQDLFNANESARVLSLMMVIQGIGPIAAPILGAYLYTFFGWRSVFLFLTVFGICCLLAAMKNIPETLDTPRSIRPASIIANFNLLLTDRNFMVPLLAGSLSLSTMFVFISASPFVFMTLYGISEEHYSWLFGFYAFGMLISAQLNTILLKRFSPATIFQWTVTFLLVMAGLLVSLSTTDNLILFSLPLFFCVATVPVTAANSTAMAMAASGKNAGTASSLVGVTQFLVAGLISALVGLLHNQTAYPMTIVICAVAVLALLVFQFRKKHQT